MNLKKVMDLLIKKRNILDRITSLDAYDSDSDQDEDEFSEEIRKFVYYALDNEVLVLTKKVDIDVVEKDKNRQWKNVETVKNKVKDWPQKETLYNDFFGGDFLLEDEDTLKLENERLQSEITELGKRYEDELAKRDNLTNTQKQELEVIIGKIHSAGLNKEALLTSLEELEAKLTQMGVKYEGQIFQKLAEGNVNLSTMIIKNVSDDGNVLYGVNSLEKNSRVISFDKDQASKVRKLTVQKCEKIIQLDLTGLINLEKLTLRKSK